MIAGLTDTAIEACHSRVPMTPEAVKRITEGSKTAADLLQIPEDKTPYNWWERQPNTEASSVYEKPEQTALENAFNLANQRRP